MAIILDGVWVAANLGPRKRQECDDISGFVGHIRAGEPYSHRITSFWTQLTLYTIYESVVETFGPTRLMRILDRPSSLKAVFLF